MSQITINYVNLDGTSHTKEFPDDSTEIQLILKEMKSIDLAPLSQCKNLQKFTLNHSHAEEIDISPLAACPNLIGVWLNDNSLKEVDVSSLFTCTNLGIVEIDEETILKAQNHLGDSTVQSAGITGILNRIEWY